MSGPVTPGGIVTAILHFVDKPWKIGALVVLAILAGGGWFLFTERARIADRLLQSAPESKLLPEVFAEDARRLLQITGADATVLMAVNLDDNLLRTVRGVDRDGRPWLPLEGQQLALYPDSSMPVLFKLLRNEVVCADISDTTASKEFQAEYALGMRRTCLVAVPPLMHEMVGILIVSWRKARDASGEAHASVVMQNAALKYATW